ncbi:MAG: peptidylprolyl isomerase [Burkholderiales bacterium]
MTLKSVRTFLLRLFACTPVPRRAVGRLSPWRAVRPALLPLLAALLSSAPLAQAAERRSGDFIVAVVNRELVTNSEVQDRLARVTQEASRGNAQLPPPAQLRQRLLDQLIDERSQLAYARESGVRVDDADLDRATSMVAAQNQITPQQLRDRLRAEGIDFQRFRTNIRDQMLLERVREREVQGRIRISDTEIENWLSEQRAKAGLTVEYDIAQILIAVPEGASPAVVSERRARAVTALQRLHGGEDFNALVGELSEGSKENGGRLGMRSAQRLPDLFVDAVQPLRPGEVAPQVVRSGAGFHVLKLMERRDAALAVTQQHARHILLRPGPQLTQDTAITRLAGFKRDVEAGRSRFEELARRFSEDGSATGGGDLGWAGPGQFVPEFEEALSALRLNQVSDPVVSRFGVHLIQLLERREVKLDVRAQRESARTALREQKYDEAYAEWAREVRARAYVELRDPPQ